ncbi:YxiJ family protein [Paenibacillus sp. BK720]|uniref:YxiJ family protein n=1 Tax=Paenibacillus sp. BK720 TaxID=2587092 RepID=UPI001424158E|nr:YxiJ family protein [Paenibacillus sp. BK720]NIK68648.1 hypothetical protein [Paenibacillus sp. BK720]
MKEQIEELQQIYNAIRNNPFPYDDFRDLQMDFEEEFNRYAPDEIINADFSTYRMYVLGLSQGGVFIKLHDPLERFKMKEWLQKSFYDWFPKYRFIEQYDLSAYEELHKEWSVVEILRHKLLKIVKDFEKQLK